MWRGGLVGVWQHAVHNALQRNGELRQLEADLGDLHTLFKDVATLAQLQQVPLPHPPPNTCRLRASAASAAGTARRRLTPLSDGV